MKGKSIRYGVRFGCRFGMPHDYAQLTDTKSYKIEKCRLCGKRKRWNKAFKQRIDNTEYLKEHVRSFCQKFGSTKRVHAKLYNKKKLTIAI